MKRVLSFIMILMGATGLWGQVPELIKDFTPGSGGSFSEWNYKGIVYKDAIILPIISSEFGEELAILKDGELRLLKDIHVGTNGSKPKKFKVYKDFLYFSADDGVNGKALWRTDGTEEGTVMFFDPGSSSSAGIRELTIAKNGWMYYSYRTDIFRTDGVVNEKVYSGGTLGGNAKHASKNYCKYKNGIAFVTKNDDDSFSLVHIDDKEAVELAKTEKTGFFAQAFGVAPFKLGLMFSIEGSDNQDAIYAYNADTKALNKLPINGALTPSRRTIDLNEDINICWIGGEGYYSVNGVPGEEQLLVSSHNNVAVQGDTIIYTQYEDKVVFFPMSGAWLEDDFLVSTDGSKDGTRKMGKFSNKYVSGMLRSGKYAFMVEGVSNNFTPKIHVVDLEKDEVKDLYNFTQSSVNINSVRPIGLLGGYLYYISNLDASVGDELYRINTNLNVSTEEVAQNAGLEYVQNGNQLTVVSDRDAHIGVKLYTVSGQLMINKNVESNVPFTLDLPVGVYYLTLQSNAQSKASLLYIR